MTIQPGPTITIDGKSAKLLPANKFLFNTALQCSDNDNAMLIYCFIALASADESTQADFRDQETLKAAAFTIAARTSDEDVEKVDKYLADYITRINQAAFTVPDEGKKPTAATGRRKTSR